MCDNVKHLSKYNMYDLNAIQRQGRITYVSLDVSFTNDIYQFVGWFASCTLCMFVFVCCTMGNSIKYVTCTSLSPSFRSLRFVSTLHWLSDSFSLWSSILLCKKPRDFCEKQTNNTNNRHMHTLPKHVFSLMLILIALVTSF